MFGYPKGHFWLIFYQNRKSRVVLKNKNQLFSKKCDWFSKFFKTPSCTLVSVYMFLANLVGNGYLVFSPAHCIHFITTFFEFMVPNNGHFNYNVNFDFLWSLCFLYTITYVRKYNECELQKQTFRLWSKDPKKIFLYRELISFTLT